MKNLPIEYWQQDYTIVPDFYQRNWVQRCLELLDADTSYLFSLDSVNSAMLIEELVLTSPHKPDKKEKDGGNLRTFHFLLNELQSFIDTDIALQNFERSYIKSLVHEGVEKSSLLFDNFGNSLKGKNASQLTKNEFVEWLQLRGMAQGDDQGIVKQLHEGISQNNRESWLNVHHESLLNLLASSVNEDYLERITQNWLIELLVYHQFGPIHLIELITNTFLTKSNDDFMERVKIFLKKLSRPAYPFTVFMRIQARKEFRRVNRIDRIEFAADGQKGIDILNETLLKGNLDPEVEVDAKRFFYRDSAPRHTFAILEVSAKNIGSAARMAIRELEHAIKQARFEFERSDFSHDNAMFVLDKSNSTFHRFTRRQALADQYIARGNPERFESFVNQLNHVRQHSQNGAAAAVITQISDLALQWHRNAVETQQPEIRFMNNWIELEQVFKTAKAFGLIDGSSSDAVSRAVTGALTKEHPWRYAKDVWGDFERCDVFGPKPYRVHRDGIIRYTNSYQKRIQTGANPRQSYSRRRNNPVDIEIFSQDKDRYKVKGYRIPDGFHIFVKDNEKVKAGQYLAGLELEFESIPNILLSAFEGKVPNLLQAVYIVLHGSQITDGQYPLKDSIDPLMIAAIRSLSDEDVLDMEWLTRLCNRISDELETKITVKDLKNNHNDLDSRLSAKPKSARTNEISSQLSYARQKLQQIPDEKWIPLKFLYEFSIDSHHPGIVKFELYRGKSPSFPQLRRLLCAQGKSLASLLPDQPLLRSRVDSASATLRDFIDENREGFQPPEAVTMKYLWTLDRMRRTRNDLVHSGEVPANIELIARQLYHYSKIYINSVIYSLGYLTSESNTALLQKILYLPATEQGHIDEQNRKQTW